MKTFAPRIGNDRRGMWWTNKGALFWGCPECGQTHKLVTHSINEDGQVMPSVVCGKCDFHEYIVLEEVSPEAIRALAKEPTNG
jgi:C4-type Zn-finger protein